MRTCWIYFALGLLAIILVCSTVALADEVETKSGQTVQGLVRSGIPLTITLEELGFIIHINRSKIREIKRGTSVDAGPPIFDEVVTVEGEIFRGTITTAMPSALLLQTNSGFAEIKHENIRRIYFEAVQPAEAESASSWGVAFNPSVLVGTSTSPPAWTFMYGVTVSKDFTSFLSARVELGYALNALDISIGRIVLSLFLAEGSAILRLPLEDFTPYIGIGAALVQLNLKVADEQQMFWLVYYDLVLGAEIRLGGNFALFTNFKLPYFSSPGGAATNPMPVIMWSTGISFAF